MTLKIGATTVPVTASLAAGDQVLSLTPGAPLSPNTTYTVTVADVQSTAGIPIASTYTFSFTTGTGALLQTFQALSATPANGAISVPASVAPQVVFNSPVNPVSASGTVQLYTVTNAVVPSTLSFSADFKTVTVMPTSPLTSSSTYHIETTYSGVVDQAGNIAYTTVTNAFTIQ